jgi:glycosyltransferase involved in cell wall biosynthesis
MPAAVSGLPVVTLVVDDASVDGTREMARKEGALVARLPIRRGQGMALRVGYEIALRLGATVIASVDADGQHDPDELRLVVEPVVRGEADMAVGSRVLGEYQKESHLRHLGVYVLSGLVSLLYGQRVTDVSSGLRATRADLMRRLQLEQDQYSSEILVEALRHKAKVKEVPMTVRARASGESKKPSSLRYGWRFTKVMLQTWLR